MFQTQYTNRNKIASIIPTGLEPDTRTYPVVYLKPDGSSNEPLAFGGMDDTKINIRAIVIADSQFDIDAIGSLFRDQRQKNRWVSFWSAAGEKKVLRTRVRT